MKEVQLEVVVAFCVEVHSCQLSRNLRDSPEFLTCVPEGSRKTSLAQIVPEEL